ncbi:MAG: hypothetical protein MJ157_06495 [Clostridia bacterium]|nr:hypothetical protein [Clostridia bacterium]
MMVAPEYMDDYSLPQEDLVVRRKVIRRVSQEHKARKALVRLILIFALLAGFMTYYTVQVITIGYQITQIENDLGNMQQSLKEMQEKVANLNSLENIEYIAIKKLGMFYPESKDIVKIKVHAGGN